MKYNFDINNRAFNAIKNKTKRVEIRVTKLGEKHFNYSVLKNASSTNRKIDFNKLFNHIFLCFFSLNNLTNKIYDMK